MFNLFSFYRSREWEAFRELVISERTKPDGLIYDEVTGRPILKRYDLILHHKIELTEENVNDYNISLNPDNIMVLSHKSHNTIHNRFCGTKVRRVFLVWGAPLSGKTSYVRDAHLPGDLIVDIDSIWESVSGEARYIKPKELKPIVFRIRDAEIDAIKYRLGQWQSAYLIGGYPIASQRKHLCDELHAREIFVDSTNDECLQRLEEAGDGRNVDEWRRYIDDWFEDAGL